MSVYKTPRGDYMADVTDPELSGGRTRRRFKRKRDALAWEARLRQELASGEYQERQRREESAVSMRDWWPRYLEATRTGATGRGGQNRPKTLATKEAMWRNHLDSALGSLLVEDVTTRWVNQLVLDLKRKGLANGTVNRCLALVRHMLTTAEHWELIDRAPKIRSLKEDGGRVEWLNEEELGIALEVAGHHRTLLLFAARTGMRLGEIRALRWENLHLGREPRVDVLEAITKVKGVGEVLGPTKSGKERSIPLAADAAEVLRNHPRAIHSPRVFPGEGRHGEVPTSTCSSYMRVVRRAILRHTDLPQHFTWHLCRHTFASQLVAAGVPLHVVQRLGGWSSIQMVMRYAHLAPDGSDLRNAIAHLGNPTAAQRGTIAAPSDSEPR